MALTDLAIKRALPGTKIIKLSDGGGLQLWMTPDGAKRWRLAYRFRRRSKDARHWRLPRGRVERRKGRSRSRQGILARGQDPSQVKKAAKVAQAEAGANTFAADCGRIAEKKRRDKKGGGDIAQVRMVHELCASRTRIATD